MKSRWLLGAGVLLVLVLVGGRWLALETAERAWAASIAGGDVYLEARSLARLFRGAVLLFSITWATANLFFVYRAIGSVQMPRRLGDLEIVEAIPHRVLLSVTIISGVVFGVVMTWGTGAWWLDALLASAPPQFGIADPVLSRDLGYYAGVLPWTASLQDHALAAVATITVVVGLLYIGMGSLRWTAGRPDASPHARGHLGFLLATLAVMFAWGALLDPAELVGGLHGAVDRAAIDFRIPGSDVVAAMAVAVALASLAWGWLGRPNLLVGGWLALVVTAFLVYLVVPAAVRSGRSRGSVSAETPEGVSLRETAFGIRVSAEESLPAFADPVEAAGTLPLWDPDLVRAALHRPLGGVGLDPAATTPTWLAVPQPDEDALDNAQPRPSWTAVHRAGGGGSWTNTGPALRVVEVDSGIGLAGPATNDSALWFGPGFLQFAVAPPDAATGIPLTGGWLRFALFWTLQSPELARDETDGLVLLWRREAKDRLERVAPFAVFESAQPAVADGALWWLAHGYVASEVFPLMTATPWQGRRVRYLRAGLVGRVHAVTGETRISFVPGADSLTAAWARIFAPLVEPAESLPPALRRALRFPRETFNLAAAAVSSLGTAGDTTPWRVRPRQPFDLVAGGAVWTAQALEKGAASHTAGLLAGVMAAEGPRLVLWRSATPAKLPAVALGSADRKSGPSRLWPTGEGGRLFSLQALFAQREGQREPPRLLNVYFAWGDRVSEGPTVSVALRDLVSGRLPALAGPGGTAPQRLEAARRIIAQADSALAAHDMERFGRLYDQLRRLLAPTYRRD